MKEHNTHNTEDIEITPNFKEEGILTVETLDIASHDATATSHKTHIHHTKHFALTTPIAILLGAIIIAGGIISYGFIIRGGVADTPNTNFTGRAVDSSDYIDGKADSKVVVIEYSDPECPFCVQSHPTIKQLRTDYADKIAFVYRYFPLTQIHPHAHDESKAILCAGTVGGAKKFYEYIDALYGYKVTNKTTQLPKTGKEDTARNIGLDKTAFANCMSDKKTGDAIDASTNDGVAAGVQGTPTTFVLVKTRKGYDVVTPVDGARPYSYFKAAVDEALNR